MDCSLIVKKLGRIGLIIMLTCVLASCGNIVDKDRIRVAKIGDNYVTRGDLYRHLRLMSPEERPHINNRGDLLRVLENYIDEKLQKRVVDELLTEGELEAPPKEQIAKLYDAQHPEMKINPENPEQFGMTEADVEAIQQKRQKGIEELRQQLLKQEAIVQAVQKAVEAEKIAISEKEYREEYEMRKNELFKPEKVTFRALIFPAQTSDAGPNSAEARKRLVKEEPWEKVAQSFTKERKAIPLQTTFTNTGRPKFQSFWEQASGTQKGRILGPLIIEDWEMVTQAAGNQPQRTALTGYLVAEVLESTPPAQKNIEEAKPDLAPAIYYVKFMKALREKHDVQIYEDRLPEPSLFREESDDPLVNAL
ncbi:MAG: peptidyl-prolyl cis-trans isomerase [Candidatus Hydrogenedentota bacterium]